MARVRPKGPNKEIQGTDAVIVKTTAQHLRQVRCPRCGLMAVPMRNPEGGMVTVCPNGHTFGNKPM